MVSRSSRARRIARGGVAAILALGLLGAARAARAADDEPALVPVNVMVVQTSNRKGEVDPRARALDADLKKQLRYRSMRVIREERVNLHVDQVGTIPLPDGRSVRVRPMHKGKQGVLMAVDVDGAVKLDARTRNRHRVVIGAGAYEDGNLAISIEPDYEE